MKAAFSFLLLFCVFLSGCPFLYAPYDRYIYLQPRVINLEMLNTPYDEINAVGPPGYFGEQDLLFSSNALSRGDHLDILYSRLTVSMNWFEGTRDNYTTAHTFSLSATEPVPFLKKVNSPYNEYGPALFNERDGPIYLPSTEILPRDFLYLLASDRPTNGTLVSNIYLYTEEIGLLPFAGNSLFHDYYPTYHKESQTLFFCSDRDGSFQLYRYSGEGIENLKDLLTTPLEAEQVQELNSPGNDKCPFIFQDILLWVSDREGPFHMYFSRYQGENWSAPKRLPYEIQGKKGGPVHLLNSEYNEYRPILFQGYWDRTTANHIMIFSSDRPGGQGGFDLYLAVLPVNIFD